MSWSKAWPFKDGRPTTYNYPSTTFHRASHHPRDTELEASFKMSQLLPKVEPDWNQSTAWPARREFKLGDNLDLFQDTTLSTNDGWSDTAWALPGFCTGHPMQIHLAGEPTLNITLWSPVLEQTQNAVVQISGDSALVESLLVEFDNCNIARCDRDCSVTSAAAIARRYTF